MPHWRIPVVVKLTTITLVALVAALAVMAFEVKPEPRFSEEQFRNNTLGLLAVLQQQPLDSKHVTATVTGEALTAQDIPLGQVVVVDADWRVLYDSTGATAIGRELPDIPGHLDSYNGYQLAVPIRQKGHIAGYLLRSLAYEEVWGSPPLYNELVPVRMFVAALVCMFLVYVFSFGMRRNFRRIMATIDQLASGQLLARAQVGARDELGHLASQLGDMAASLEKAQQQEAELVQARDELVAGISHDLRTPLTSIIGYSQLLQEGVAGNRELASYAVTVCQKARCMQGLVDELLRYTKLRLGRLEAKYEAIDLGDLVAQCVIEHEADFAQIGRSLVLHRSGRAVSVWADGELLGRVVRNLLVNAFHHAEGATRVDVFVAALATDAGPGLQEGITSRVVAPQWAAVSVADNGIGIPSSEIPLLFQRFYHGQQNSATAQPSSGLGLAIAQEIAALHGGTISVSSEPDSGTTFTVTLPMASGSVNTAPA